MNADEKLTTVTMFGIQLAAFIGELSSVTLVLAQASSDLDMKAWALEEVKRINRTMRDCLEEKEIDGDVLCLDCAREATEDDTDPGADFDRNACPGCGGNCQTACR